ncbi:tetratricopeptide repeat protein [Laspinema sp. D1]|uniref:Tetratricopeptide repeat protein n=1 Tax=Laspinema palackyanum D2a TaxID=2953684 RepID=A0ABT2MZ40_9CYAN|nr:tetratricopeptide repeat protein [Laspinema sp. D2a]
MEFTKGIIAGIALLKITKKVMHFSQQGNYAAAIPLAQKAIKISRKTLGSQNAHVATYLNNLAELYRCQGRYAEAEPLYLEALGLDRIVLPQNHPNLARDLNNLAVLYQSQGRYAETEPLYLEAMNIDRIVLPQNHPDLARDLNNLATLYESQGRYDEAEPLYLEVLDIIRIALPKNHPHIATVLNNLALLYESQGRYPEAEPLCLEALKIDRITLPENHPQLATHLSKLASLYYAQGRYSEAEPLHNEAVAIDRIALPKNHPSLATHLNNLALLYESQGRYSEAEPVYSEAIAIDRIALPQNHPSLATDLNNLARLYKLQGRYSEAEPLYLEALKIIRIALPKNHPSLAATLNNLGQLYSSQGRYPEAEPLYLEALKIDGIALPENHPSLAGILNNLAELYRSQGRYAQAEPLYLEVLEIIRIALPKNHPQLATYLNNLAGLYCSQGRYAEAEPLLLEALEINRIALPENHPSLAGTLNNLARLYKYQGRYTKARYFCEQAIKIARIALPQNHPHLAVIHLSTFGQLCLLQGRYPEAEPLLLEALEIIRIALPKNHPALSDSLNNLACLYHKQKRYAEAETFVKESLGIDRMVLRENNPNFALHCNTLADIYRLQGRYIEAQPLYMKAIEIIRIALPKNHPYLSATLNNLSLLYQSQKSYSQSESLYLEALEIDRAALPENHPDIARDIHNLAYLYEIQQKYIEAESYYLEAIKIDRIALPENHPDLTIDVKNLALLYTFQGRYKKAWEQFQAALESENLRLQYIFSTSSDRERREYLQKNPETYYLFLNLVWQHLRDDTQAVGDALDAVLGRKAIATAALAAQNAAIYSGRYSAEIQTLFREWQKCNERLLEATYNPPRPDPERPEIYPTQIAEHRKRLSKLQQDSENLEKQLAKEIPELQLSQQEVNRNLVAAQLPDGSALVEFVRFKRYDFGAPKGEKWQEDRYIAFVVMAHQPEQVRLVDLGEAEPLDKLIKAFRRGFVGWEDNLGARRNPASVPTPVSPTQQLQETLCQPLIEALPSVSHCFLAPDSNLNLLPFQILPLSPASNSHYIGDKYRISYLNSGRDLLRQEISDRPLKICPATILADPDYDWNGTEPRQQGSGKQQSEEDSNSQPLPTLSGFSRAVGTDIFGIRAGELLGVAPYLRENALSLHLTHGNCPRILAVATHGFYRTAEKPYLELIRKLLNTKAGTETQCFEQHPSLISLQLVEVLEQFAEVWESKHPPVAQRMREFVPLIRDYLAKHPIDSRLDAADADNPMYRGGIALAGANVWNQGGELPDGNKGILFAQDIAALDLWGNELSALIACQTGLGEVASGDSVGGLRRAFVVSGSKSQVMSLWSVPARATVYLMERFFHHLNRGLGRAEALSHAQFEVRTVTAGELRQSKLGGEILQELNGDYADEDCPLSSPYYWGAWVCQGDISPLSVELNESRV